MTVISWSGFEVIAYQSISVTQAILEGKKLLNVEILERISSVFAQANHWNVFYLERIS